MKMPRMTDERVQEQALPNVGFNVDAGDFGLKNIQKTEQAVTGLADTVSKIYEKQRQQADEAVQLEAGTRAAQKELEWNRKIRETRGENVLGLAEEYEKDWSAFRSDVEKTLVKSPKQKMMVDRIISSNYAQLRSNIDEHTAKELDAVYDNKSKAMIEMDRAAALDSLDPMRIAESIGKQKAIIQQMADKNGWSGEELKVEQDAVERETKTDYIQRVAESDPDTARKILSEEKSIIGGDLAIKMDGYITRRERQLKYIAKSRQIDNDISFMTDFANGKIGDINTLLKSENNGISPELAKAVIAYETDPEIITVEDTPAFTAYAERVFDIDDKEALSKLLVDTLSGGTDGKPNMEEIKSLVKIVAIRSKGMTLKEFDEKQRNAKKVVKKSFIDNAFDAVRSWASSWSKDKETTARVYKDLISEVEKKPPQSAEQASNVVSTVLEKAQAATNPNRTAYKIDQIISYNGKTYKVTGFDEDGEPLVDEVK